MGYRVLVKLEGMKKYQAVVTEGGEVKVSDSSNKLYHSYFTEMNAIKLRDALIGAGIDAKIVKG